MTTETVGKIPVRNLWLLMLYASNLLNDVLRGASAKRQDYEENPEDIFELIAEILTDAVEHRLRHNLTVDLTRKHDTLTRVRGRIDHIRTERHHLLEQGMIACTFDEFTADTQKNRLVRQALDRLSHMSGLKPEWRQRCRADSGALEKAGVGKTVADPFSINRLGGASTARTARNPEDQKMLAAAELALYLRIPTEEEGLAYFDALDRNNESWVRHLFEKAVAGFYSAKFPTWNVQSGRWLKWQKDTHSDGIDSILPSMQTDIVIEKIDPHTRKRSKIVIDTKFTEIMTASEHRLHILKSKHMYQLYTYLRSQESGGADDMSRSSSGMLLYPSVKGDVDEWFMTQGHVLRFATVDLSADSKDIRDRLLYLIQNDPF